MIAGGFAPCEAAIAEIDEDAPGPRARYLRLRLAASVLVDFLSADLKVPREKILGRSREKAAVDIRRKCWAALERAGYGRDEIADVFERDVTVVLRSNELVLKGPKGNPGARELDIELGRLLEVIERGPTREVQPVECAPYNAPFDAMRASYDILVERMHELPHDRAVEVWREWCRREYPFTWEGTSQTLPREYRLRHPGRFADDRGVGAALPEDHFLKRDEDCTGLGRVSTDNPCTTRPDASAPGF